VSNSEPPPRELHSPADCFIIDMLPLINRSMNMYFIFAGILLMLLAVAHLIWGEKQIVRTLRESDEPQLVKTGFAIGWYQITGILFLLGFSLILLTSSLAVEIAEMIATISLMMILGNLSIFVIISTINYKGLLKQSLPQIVLFGALIAMLVVGLML